MKRILFGFSLCVIAQSSFAQITITANDMPVNNDTLRWSSVSPVGSGINLNDSGANHTWDYSNLAPIAQGLDQYKSATSVNLAWLLIDPTAYGYKIADSVPGLPVPVTNVYTFFAKKNSPSRYSAVGFGATIAGLPTPASYSDPDEWYFFPLTYGNAQDSSTYNVTASVLSLGSWTQSGYRLTKVDGWGTIKTPYFTSSTNCIRVRTEKVERDSVHTTTPIDTSIVLPIHTVEYKFLVNGEHYPALWVTAAVITDTATQTNTETITSIRFRDIYRDSLHPNGVETLTQAGAGFGAYPNPSSDGRVFLDIPASWQNFAVEVFDMQGKLVYTANNKRELNLQSLAKGEYIAHISSGNNNGYIKLSR